MLPQVSADSEKFVPRVRWVIVTEVHPHSDSDDVRAPRSSALTLALLGIGLEALAALAGAVLLVMGIADIPSELIAMTLFLVAMALGLAVALVFSGRALARGSRRGRAPTITWQIFQVIIGAGALQAGNPVVGVPLIAVAIVVVVSVLRLAAAAERSVDG